MQNKEEALKDKKVCSVAIVTLKIVFLNTYNAMFILNSLIFYFMNSTYF